MNIEVHLSIEVERESGMNRSRDLIEEQIVQAIEDANPDSLDVEDSEYSVADWTVEIQEPVKVRRPQPAHDRPHRENLP